MTLFEKTKINIDYLFGNADPSLYAPAKNRNLSSEDWQTRWEIFSDHGCGFVWYGVDSEGNLAEFACNDAFVPEAFFNDVSVNRQLQSFFQNLPEITTTQLAECLSPRFRQAANRFSGTNDFWKTGANKGIFIFEETDDDSWYMHYRKWDDLKYPYELLLIPDKSLKVTDLPNEIQRLLEPYHFENLRFRDCQFLDVSKYLYCEK